MKNKKIGIIALVIFMIVIVSQNIMLMNKTNKLLGTVPSRNIDSNEVEYTETKTVQGAINDLAEKANIIGTDEEKNKFRDDSKTIIGQIGTDKLNTTSQNLTGAINEINSGLSNIGGVQPGVVSNDRTVPAKKSKEIATLTLDKPGTYIIFASHQWNKSWDVNYTATISGVGYVSGNMLGGGGIILSGVLETTIENYKISYTTYQAGSESATAQGIYLTSIRIK